MLRVTRQRTAIQAVFEAEGRPLGPHDAWERARKKAPGLGIATVYRTINQLVESGQLVEVPIPGQPLRYELSGLQHHHHFVCRKCQKVYDLPSCPGKLTGMAPKGFRVDHHDITLFGLCPKCQ